MFASYRQWLNMVRLGPRSLTRVSGIREHYLRSFPSRLRDLMQPCIFTPQAPDMTIHVPGACREHRPVFVLPANATV
jgi:hypothetical protein